MDSNEKKYLWGFVLNHCLKEKVSLKYGDRPFQVLDFINF